MPRASRSSVPRLGALQHLACGLPGLLRPGSEEKNATTDRQRAFLPPSRESLREHETWLPGCWESVKQSCTWRSSVWLQRKQNDCCPGDNGLYATAPRPQLIESGGGGNVAGSSFYTLLLINGSERTSLLLLCVDCCCYSLAILDQSSSINRC